MRLISAGSLVRAQSGPPPPKSTSACHACKPLAHSAALAPPNQQQPGHRTCPIDHHIVRRGSARRHKRLMKFIDRGADRDQDQHRNRHHRETAPPLGTLSINRAPQQNGENAVLREMPALPNHEVNRLDGPPAHRRKKPVQKGIDDARSMRTGERIARREENPNQPETDRKPRAQEATARFRHRAF